MIQNIAPAPSERSVKSANGEIAPLLVKSLHITMLRPNMRYAAKQAICPKKEFCVAIKSVDWAKIIIF